MSSSVPPTSSESNDNSNARNTPSDTSNTTPTNASSSTPVAPSQETENSSAVQPSKNSNSNVNSSSNLEAPQPPSPQGQESTQAPPPPSNLNANSNSNSKNAPAPQQSEEIFKPLPSLAPLQTSNSSSMISNSRNVPSPSTSPNSKSNSETLPPPTIVSPTLQTPQTGSIKPMNPPPSQITPTNLSTPFPPNQPVTIIKSPDIQVPSKQLPPAGLSPPQQGKVQAGASPPFLNSPYYYPVQKSTISKRSMEIGPFFIFIGVVSVLLAVIYLVARKKRKPEDLVHHYDQHAKSDIVYQQSYHYTGTPPTDHYLGPPRASTSSQTFSGNLQSSNSGNYQTGYYPGTPNNHTATKSCFSYEEIMDITGGFSRENLLGEGGFGCVFKGWLSDGRCVAVKQLKVGSGQGEREFRAEVEIISRIHHRHLVSLVGYCIVEQHRMLVYEFVPNSTLEYHLHGKGIPTMDWGKRMKIAIGSARGLAYLHEDCHPRIIHRDIKSANILLDYAFEAQVADFGLAKFTNDSYTHVSTRIMGTFGYLAPEYASSGKLTDRSDVFSFGVVLLELITGRKPVDADESLVEWARPLLVQALETGNIEELVDSRLEKNYKRDEMYRMIEAAAACVRHSAPKRPRMVQVLRALENSGGQVMDLTNGVKVGQSTAFDPNKYSSSEIQRFQKVAFSIEEESSEEGDTPNKYLTRSGTRFVNS